MGSGVPPNGRWGAKGQGSSPLCHCEAVRPKQSPSVPARGLPRSLQLARNEIVLFGLLVLLIASSGCAKKLSPEPQAPTKLVLTAAETDQVPSIDGDMADSAWKKGGETVVPTKGGPAVRMKALRSRDELFVLATWVDTTNDNIDQVWTFDGTKWAKGVNDDSFALFWNVNNSISGFNQKGCQVVCHNAPPQALQMELLGPPAPQGELWSGRNQKGDIWDLALGIGNTRGTVSDYVFTVDPNYRRFPKTLQPRIYRQHDVFERRAPWKQNYVVDQQTGVEKPAYAYKAGLNLDNTPYPTYDQVMPIADYFIFKAGDRLPFMLFTPSQELWGGSKVDITGKGVWQDGRWVVEMRRRLDTGHDDDIQFKIPRQGSNYYVFAPAVFDHTIVGHYPGPPVALEIAPSSVSGSQAKPEKPAVRAVYSKSAPKIDGQGKDKTWSGLTQAVIPTKGGAAARIKSVYTKDRIYFLVSWPDKTPQDGKLYWGFDGTRWERHYEPDDKIALLWNINHSVKGFDQQGCQAVCHNGQMAIEGQNMGGGKIWAGYKQKADAWKWAPGVMQVVRVVDDGTFGVDDAFLEHPRSFSVARLYLRFDNGDKGTKQYFTRNPRSKTVGSGEDPYPAFKLKPGLTFESTPFPNQSQMEEITDYSVFKAGDKIPLLMFFDLKASYNKERFPQGKPAGSRVDIKGYGAWKDGWWTLEFERKLNTGHDDDVQFVSKRGDLISGNIFDLALFDDTRFGHTTSGSVRLVLEQPE